MTARRDAVRALVADPWYQLSTAGQELFHTNMLYWLALQRPEQSRPVWEALGLGSPVHVEHAPIVRREWQHIDLFIDSGLGCQKLVLENKVLAIPTSKQLVNYRAKLLNLKHFKDDATSWVMLSLLAPTFQLPEPWRPVGYDDLLPAFESTAANLEGDDAQLVAGYTRLVGRLVNLRDAFDPLQDLDAPMFLDAADSEPLQTGRVSPLICKMQMSRCAEQIAASLEERLDAPIAEVSAGLTNTQGLVQWFTPGPKGRYFGWQAQGHQVRLVGIASKRDPKKREQRERVIEESHLDYFDFTVPPGLEGLLTPYTGKKPWLGYEPDFVYRYQTLRPEVTWRQFIDLAVWFSEQAHRYATWEVKG
jgi:hypothetical protein